MDDARYVLLRDCGIPEGLCTSVLDYACQWRKISIETRRVILGCPFQNLKYLSLQIPPLSGRVLKVIVDIECKLHADQGDQGFLEHSFIWGEVRFQKNTDAEFDLPGVMAFGISRGSGTWNSYTTSIGVGGFNDGAELSIDQELVEGVIVSLWLCSESQSWWARAKYARITLCCTWGAF
jgi:hypothetical protein